MMRHAPVSLLLLALAGPAVAQPAVAVSPVFGQVVAQGLPEGFVAAWEQAVPGFYLREAVPQGETVESWSQMVTLTGAAGAAGLGAEEAAARIAAGYAGACPDSFASRPLGAPAVPGARETAAVWVACGRTAMGGAERSEAMVLLVLVGARDLYTMQWAERGPAEAAAPAYEPARWDARAAFLAGTARLCDPVPGEGPPYPSCVD